MSDVNLDFIVNNNSINFTVAPNDITFTPSDIQLTFNTSSQLNAGGSNTQLQYNNGDLLAGIPTATYNGSNLSLGNVANLKITGGTNGYVLQTDGTGNLDWTLMSGNGGGNGTPGGSNTQIQYNDSGAFGGNVGFTFNEVNGNVNIPGNLSVVGNIIGSIANANYASYAGNVVNNAQPNITSIGILTSLSVSGNIDTGVITSNSANINTLQLNSNNIALGNGAGYANQGINTVAIGLGAGRTNQGANSIAIGADAGYLDQGANSIIINATSFPISTNPPNSFTVKPIRNANTANALYYNSSTGEISYDTAIVANANYASYAGTVLTSAQPNITSLGLLTNVSISGNVTASQLISNVAIGTAPLIVTSTTVVANLRASMANLANFATTANAVAGANVSGTVANATYATSAGSSGSATTAATVTTNAQPNITSVGTLTSLSVSGNITATNFIGKLANSTSNIAFDANGNVNISAAGTNNILVVSKIGAAQGANISGFANITGNANVGNIGTSTLTATGNIQGATVVATGNVTGGNIKTVSGLIETTNGNIYANNGYIVGGEGVFTNLRFVSNISSNASASPVGVSVATHKFPIVLNGTTYYILLTT